MRFWPAVIAISLLSPADFAAAAEWATLCGRFVYDGTPPTPKRITIDKDVEVCGKQELFDESLTVHPSNRGVKDVVVQLTVGRGETVAIHESYQQDALGEVLLDNKYCRFTTHVTVMRTSQKLVIRNSDPMGDNVKIDPSKNTAINITLPGNGTHTQEFRLAERMPVKVSCAIHPWESAWLVISEHPYVGVSDADGRFEIKHVAVGKRSFMFWQEKAGYVAEVTLAGAKQQWRRGVQEFDLQPGMNDLGDIVLSPSLFLK